MGRRNLGNVQRRDHRRAADGQPADEAGNQELPPVLRQAATGRRHEIAGGQHKQDILAAEYVGRLAHRTRTDNRADQRNGHREAKPERVELKNALQGFGGAGNDHRIEAEQQTPQRSDDGPANDCAP